MSKTFASLFTGGGLADIGAQQAGYDLLWGVEFDAEIASIANANLPHKDAVHADSVIGFDWAKVERPDHLHMSPPCQDFSVAKTTGKVANPNDDIADACIEALAALKPDTVTLENVEGYRKAPSFQRIVDHLWGAGYWVNADVLNSADFGVPQTRRRLVLRAVKGAMPSPLPAHVHPWAGWYDAIEDLIPSLPETEFAPWQLERLPKALAETCFVESNNRVGNIPKAFLVDGLANSHGATVTAVGGCVPSFAVKASSGKQASRALTGGRVVRMTPRCLARFQTVPDWYELPRKKSLACKIIGNGVPCLMMQRVMELFV